MKIKINFTIEELRSLLAEHCRKQFKVEPKYVDILLNPRFGEYAAEVEGDYRPD